jgi:hypothetical protein
MGFISLVKEKGKLEKKIVFSQRLKKSRIDKITAMAKEAKVSKSFLTKELLECAITLEKGIGLENYAKAYKKVNLEPVKRKTARGNK